MIDTALGLLRQLQPGGWLVALIFGVSVAGWIQGLRWLYREQLLDESDLDRFQNHLEEWSESPRENTDPTVLPLDLQRSLASHDTTRSIDRETVRSALVREVGVQEKQMKASLWFVGAAAAILPLLGLFGTLLGIIQAFEVMTWFGAGRIELLSDGISTALISTQAGLLLALPMLFLYRYLKACLDGHLNALRLMIRTMMRYPAVVHSMRLQVQSPENKTHPNPSHTS